MLTGLLGCASPDLYFASAYEAYSPYHTMLIPAEFTRLPLSTDPNGSQRIPKQTPEQIPKQISAPEILTDQLMRRSV